MDFSYLLDLAKQNEQHAKEAVQVKRYSTQVSLAKKEPRSLVQSQAIQTFLAKREQEEKKKQLDDKRKKEILLSLRAQDRKSNARVQAMVKRTKAANKAVLNDLNNSDANANITTAGLDMQPDEDDYGYVSREASELYKKLVDKYNSGTQTSEKSNRNKLKKTQQELNNSKHRVKDALHEIRQQESSGHQKRHFSQASVVVHKSTKHYSKNKHHAGDEKETPKKETKFKAPPPETVLSFDQILKLAATKQHEPIKFEKKSDEIEKREKESERLMTQRERDDLVRKNQQDVERQLRSVKSTNVVLPGPTKRHTKNHHKLAASHVSVSKKSPTAETKHNAPSTDSRPTAGSASGPRDSQSIRAKPAGTTHPGPTQPISKITASTVQVSSFSKSAVTRGQPLPSRENGSKGKSLAPIGGSRPMPPYRGIRPVARTYKRPMESDEEEDSDLDDFIDDGPDGEDDYSKHIKEIFGYDRNRYRRIESDDEGECMESSYAQQMKEERISTKIGIMEDLEEERRLQEEEERKKKILKRAKTKN